jgi:hypothetical protein
MYLLICFTNHSTFLSTAHISFQIPLWTRFGEVLVLQDHEVGCSFAMLMSKISALAWHSFCVLSGNTGQGKRQSLWMFTLTTSHTGGKVHARAGTSLKLTLTFCQDALGCSCCHLPESPGNPAHTGHFSQLLCSWEQRLWLLSSCPGRLGHPGEPKGVGEFSQPCKQSLEC